MRFFLTAYPEDLLDEGIAIALDRIQGEIGATGITFLAATPAYLRVRGREISPRIVHSRGGVFFKPTDENYESTRCKPIVSSRTRKVDLFAKIVEPCISRGLEVRIALHAGTLGRMADRYRTAACRNAWDDTSRLGLCVHNPDVQAMFGGLVSDVVSRSGVTNIEIRDLTCAWQEAFCPKLPSPGLNRTSTRALLSLCFCESCRQRGDQAGVDVASVERFIQTTLCDEIENLTAKETALSALIEQSKPLARYMAWRTQERVALVSLLSERAGGSIIIRDKHDQALTPPYPPLPRSLAYRVSVERTASPSSSEQKTTKPQAEEYGLTFNPKCGEDGAALVGYVPQLAGTGAEACTLDNYGLWSESALSYVKQALRFGRRASATELR